MKNILDEKFNLEEPNAIWCSDITYIGTYSGFVSLTSIMDLFSRKIIAWVLSDTLEAKHVVDAIEKAKRAMDKPKIMHADRGDTVYLQCVSRSNGRLDKKLFQESVSMG